MTEISEVAAFQILAADFHAMTYEGRTLRRLSTIREDYEPIRTHLMRRKSDRGGKPGKRPAELVKGKFTAMPDRRG